MKRKAKLQALVLAIAVMHIGLMTANAQAPEARRRVEGVANFGQVTEHYFRGGELTTQGIENLAALGIRTIIDLRDDAEPEEAETCKRLGITYYNFPLDQYVTPDQATIDKIFQIIREAKEPVFVHCSGGKHRAGTLCALYRMKHQGWSAERAWKEQQAYGFGPPEEHPKLFLYAYGNTRVAKRLRQEPDRKESDRRAQGNGKPANKEAISAKPSPVAAPAAATEAAATEAALSSTARYVSPAQALERARADGATGELARINLEYDTKRAVPVWKVIFATAVEYRFDARTGALLATKPKPSESLSVLSPLTLSDRYLSFQKIISIAERLTGLKAAEMELKRVRGRNQTFFEVAMADGPTLFFDALTGKQIKEF
ncbi:MAG TPA: tyrosine-protein phosphatase [Blastocatellia bacterium]|nr:tyrosine-protein phosphatase [Blastocatellia bacterium]